MEPVHGNVLTIHIDGAARGNPGPAACAYVIAPSQGPPVEEGMRLGRATNNVAEYTGLVRALEKAAQLGGRRLKIFSDSELLVKQMNGEYKVKNEDLRVLFDQAKHLIAGFEQVAITHVRRDQNRRADELCNLALDGDKPARAAAVKKQAPGGRDRKAAVREEAVDCLRAAAAAWARGRPNDPDPEAVWDQLWSVLEENGVLR